MTAQPSHTCYTVRDRGENRKPYWAIIGSGFTNKDGSLNLVLDSLPIDGKIVVRLGAAWPNKDGLGFNINCDLVPLQGRIVMRAISGRDDEAGGQQ